MSLKRPFVPKSDVKQWFTTIYTITTKQIVRLQERMHFEKIQLVQVQNGRQSDRARWLDHYYKTKCVISGEDASWKNSTR